MSAWFWLIAGPNGVGKTTYAMRYLRTAVGTVHFVNLDEIARGLSPLEPRVADRAAARVALARARELIRARVTFAMETTLAGRTHLELIEEANRGGLRCGMLYFAVPDVRLCLERIARRVAEGGHGVPEADVRRRFTRSLNNFFRYTQRAELWRLFDSRTPQPRIIVEGRGREVAYLEAEALSAFPAELRQCASWPSTPGASI